MWLCRNPFRSCSHRTYGLTKAKEERRMNRKHFGGAEPAIYGELAPEGVTKLKNAEALRFQHQTSNRSFCKRVRTKIDPGWSMTYTHSYALSRQICQKLEMHRRIWSDHSQNSASQLDSVDQLPLLISRAQRCSKFGSELCQSDLSPRPKS